MPAQHSKTGMPPKQESADLYVRHHKPLGSKEPNIQGKEEKAMEEKELIVEAAASQVELQEKTEIHAIEESFAPALSSN